MEDSGKSGYVFKEGAQFYSWKKRYLVVSTHSIYYFTNNTRKEKKGEIIIKNIIEVKLFKRYKDRKFVFGIVTPERTYYIQGSDKENRYSWCNAINESIKRVKGLQTKGLSSSKDVQTTLVVSPRESLEKGSSAEISGKNKMRPDDFQQLKVIGRGGFGRVVLVKKKDTGKFYAMKILKKESIVSRGEVEHTKTEKSILSKIEHPFLAKLHCSFQTEHHLYLVMDFINGGELFHHLSKEKKFTEERAKFYAAEIISGLAYLHEVGIIYRDLKPENLLLSHKGHIVMTDFGLSKEGLIHDQDTTKTFCGTPEYLAPEIVLGENYNKAIDWWSVGTLIYEMLTGLPPFYSQNDEQMYEKIINSHLNIPSYFSQNVTDLIKKFLTRNPAMRLQNVDKIKSHPWFNEINWEKLERLEITPPFIPNVQGPDDVRNIDSQFLKEDINVEDSDHGGLVKPDTFGGFTFQASDDIL